MEITIMDFKQFILIIFVIIYLINHVINISIIITRINLNLIN